jgi:hypothetical protein
VVRRTPSWELLECVRGWLSAITQANGYRTDLGHDVSLEPAQLRGNAPRIVVTASDMPVNGATSSARNGVIEFEIELRVPASRADAQEQAHLALADILDALPLKQAGRGLPEGSSGVEVTGRRILQRPDGADLVVAQVTARAVLSERPHTRPA